jgi:predicted NAD/FAD-binding protein
VRIAIVGTGIAGLTCAHLLRGRHDVTVFEADDRPGGHANTVTVNLGGDEHRVDTGFIVYNERNYPIFSRLLAELGVSSRPSDMSFSVSDEQAGIEWCASSPATVFAQRSNLARPSFLRMLGDVVRFNRAARRLLDRPVDFDFTLADFLAQGRWSAGFVEWYLVPMGSAIWSADPSAFTSFPAAAFARFFDNHGLLGLGDQPQWRTVVGGSVAYVTAITRPLGHRLRLSTAVSKIVRRRHGVEIATENGDVEHFDHVIVATHSDQALRLLSDPTRAEREILGRIGYRPNVATLHTDERLLPRRARARASWNWNRRSAVGAPTLTYDLGRLQGLSSMKPICLSLNQPDAIDPHLVIDTMTYWHPVFNPDAMRAQLRHGEISGHDAVSYCGAYWGYGFHEDGARSAVRVCRALGVPGPGEDG